jgi:hypothetical protein
MNLSARNKRKFTEKAVKLLPPGSGAQPVDLGVGGGGSLSPRRNIALCLGAAVAGSVGLSALTGGVVVIGWLPALILYYAINQPRAVLATDRGVALLRRGFLTGAPTGLLSMGAPAALQQPTDRAWGESRFEVDGKAVWLKDADADALRRAMPT